MNFGSVVPASFTDIGDPTHNANFDGGKIIIDSTQNTAPLTDLLDLNAGGAGDNVQISTLKPMIQFWNSVYSTYASIRAGRGEFHNDVSVNDGGNLTVHGGGNETITGGQLTIDNSSSSGALGTDQIILKSNPADDHTSIISNLQKVQFWNGTAQNGATVAAQHVQLNDGNQGGGSKVLGTSDGSGTSEWSTVAGSGGALQLEEKHIDCSSGQSDSNCFAHDWHGSAAGDAREQARIWCDSGYSPISGGGDCQYAGDVATTNVGMISAPMSSANSQEYSGTSTNYYATDGGYVNNQPNGWVVDCKLGAAHADVICAKTAPIVVTVTVPPVNPPPPPPPPPGVPAGYTALSGTNTTNNETCGQFIVSQVPSWTDYNPHDYGYYTTDLAGNNQSSVVDRQCVFKSPNSPYVFFTTEGSSGAWLDSIHEPGYPGYNVVGTATVGTTVYHMIAK